MAIINADSAELADVQDAIDSAITGDTVIVPAGSKSWSGSADIPDSKKITLQGNGIGSTIINRNAVDNRVLHMNSSGSRVTGFEFLNGFIEVYGQDWRIDHCKNNNGASWGTSVLASGQSYPTPIHPRGVIDNCIIVNGRILVYGTAYMLVENDAQHKLWAQSLTLGSADFVFVEDCDFSGSAAIDCIDCNYGGRYVFRYNIYTDTVGGYMCEFHSVQGNNRAGRAWEIYGNHVISQNPGGMWTFGFIRGGTGVAFNNTCTGYPMTVGFDLNNVRDTENRETCGQCNGSSNWDQNTVGEAGWACRDQIGRGADTSQWAPGEAYTQPSEPVYFWNNDPDTVTVSNPSSPAHIVVNRDYYLNAKSGYTPYTYPHPLRGEEEEPNINFKQSMRMRF